MKILKEKKYRVLSVISKYSFVLVLALVVIMSFPFNSLAVPGEDPQCTTDPANTELPQCTTDSSSSGVNINTKIENPLGAGNLETLPEFIVKIIEFVMFVGIPIVALAIIYTGFLFVMAQGNKEKLTTAKKALTYSLIGAALILGAFVISKAIVSTVEEIKKTT